MIGKSFRVKLGMEKHTYLHQSSPASDNSPWFVNAFTKKLSQIDGRVEERAKCASRLESI